MAVLKTLSVGSATPAQQIVTPAHFGGNALHRVNISADGQGLSNFAQSASALGLTDLRYPGGFMEDYGDILVGGTDQSLAPRLVSFLNWVRQQNIEEKNIPLLWEFQPKTLQPKDMTRQNIPRFYMILRGMLPKTTQMWFRQ